MRQVDGFLRFPPPIKLTTTLLLKYCCKWLKNPSKFSFCCRNKCGTFIIRKPIYTVNSAFYCLNRYVRIKPLLCTSTRSTISRKSSYRAYNVERSVIDTCRSRTALYALNLKDTGRSRTELCILNLKDTGRSRTELYILNLKDTGRSRTELYILNLKRRLFSPFCVSSPGTHFSSFLKLIQINVISTDNVRIYFLFIMYTSDY